MSEAYAKEMVSSELVSVGPERSRIVAILSRCWAELFIVLLVLILWAPRLSGPIDLRWDGGVYYILGTSLAEGHGYRILSEPGTPEALQYPPFLPMTVALWEKTLGSTDPTVVAPWLRISYAVLFSLYGLAVFALARVYLPLKWALAAAAMTLLHHHIVFLSDLLYAELPFALLLVVFALVAIKRRESRGQWVRELMLFSLAAAAFLLRTAGIVLFIAWIADALLRGRWQLASARITLTLIPVLGWQSYITQVQASSEYTHPAYSYQRAAYQFYNVSYRDNISLRDPFRPEAGYLNANALFRRVSRNLFALPVSLGEAVSAKADAWPLKRFEGHRPRQPNLGTAATKVGNFADLGPEPARGGLILAPILVLSALTIAGITILGARREWLILVIMLGSIALISLAPWPLQLTRYLAPLGSFFAICFFVAWTKAYGWLARLGYGPLTIAGRVALVCVVTATFAVQTYADGKLFYSLAGNLALCKATGVGERSSYFAHEESWQAWEEAANWIGTHTKRDAIIATSQPHLCYLLTGRRAVLPPMEIDPARERELLETVPVQYVIVDELLALDVTRHYVLPAVASSLNDWRVVYNNNGAAIYARSGLRQ